MAGNHGGARPGAGRPKGSVSWKTRFLAKLGIGQDDKTFLEILHLAANKAYRAATQDPDKADVGLLRQAADIAAVGAPYRHPKVGTVFPENSTRNPAQVYEQRREVVLVDGVLMTKQVLSNGAVIMMPSNGRRLIELNDPKGEPNGDAAAKQSSPKFPDLPESEDTEAPRAAPESKKP